jgi:hypothetical protein
LNILQLKKKKKSKLSPSRGIFQEKRRTSIPRKKEKKKRMRGKTKKISHFKNTKQERDKIRDLRVGT